MRVLLLFRGAPGCGKSTYIEQHGLKQYTLSADDIRLNLQAPVLKVDGDIEIHVKREKDVWQTLFYMLENRMKQGEFTVIDATNSKTSEMQRYKELADRYRYRIYCIDMTDVPIDEVKRRNQQRDKYKIVPNKAIEKMYARFATQSIPKFINIIKSNQLDKILYKPINYSEWKAIHHIGDIHGCYTVLKELITSLFSKCKKMSIDINDIYETDNKHSLSNFLNEDELYIFSGDYLDRGTENVEVLLFLLNIYQMKNVVLLEGNHEISLRNYASGIDDYPRYFRGSTLNELNKAFGQGIFKKSEVRQLCRRFGQLSYYTYNDKKVLVTHGGLSGMKENLIYVSTEQIIRGVGNYEDYLDVAKAFEKNTDESTYQVNGHRNVLSSPIHATDRCFNLEGQVENGGCLRLLTLNENGFQCIQFKNNVFNLNKKTEDVRDNRENVKIKNDLNIETAITLLRSNKNIKESKQGNISSFNFDRNAFERKIWNDQTIRARGLFINTNTNQIEARGYQKFFNINERDETKVLHLQYNLKFPVTAYVKENGFLGMISYNHEEGRLMFFTKSKIDTYANENDMISIFKSMWEEMTTSEEKQFLHEYLKLNNRTVLVEVVNNKLDPHIIKYDKNMLFLLDIVSNEFECKKVSYNNLKRAACSFGFTCKEKAITLNNWNEFYGWYNYVMDEEYKYNDKNIEGFVIEDSKGYMIKIKLYYYKHWRMLRGIAKSYLRYGQVKSMGSLCDAESNYFYGFLKENRNKYTYIDHRNKIKINNDYNFINLRDDFYNYMKEM